MKVHIVGDTRPVYRMIFKRGNARIDLSGCAVEVEIRRADGDEITKVATVTSPGSLGEATFSLSATDSGVAGRATGEVKVTFGDGGIQHGRFREDFLFRTEHERVDY